MWLNKPIAFIKKDFLIWKSYKLLFFSNIIAVFLALAIFYFISNLYNLDSVYFKKYGEKYFPFVFLGLIVNIYLINALYGLSSKIRSEQLVGTLEAILATPISNVQIIFGFISWGFFISLINILVFIAIGNLYFNFHLNLIGFFAVLLILILGSIALSSIGMISASFILCFKKGDPIGMLGAILLGFLSGVYFPIELLPPFLKNIARVIPLTYVLKALRLSLLKGYNLYLLREDIIILILFSIILLPISLALFKLALRKVLRDGAQIY